MGNVRIQGSEFAVSKLFSDDFAFSIPLYQRPYRWGTGQARELLDDLRTAVDDHPGADLEQLDPYFLGSIVVIKSPDRPESEVVDGQQRLTTLTILLAAMRQVLGQSWRQDLRKYIFQEGNAVEGTSDRPRLSVREKDAEFFLKYVQEDGGLSKLLGLDPGQLSDSRLCFQENARLFVEVLGACPPDAVQQLARFVAQKCFLVAVSTPDLDSAYRIFSVLNERGLDLSHADILKSEVLGKVARQEHYNELWENAEDELGSEYFGELFSHIRMIFARSKLRESVLQGFRSDVVKKVGSGEKLVEDVIQPYANAFSTILNESYEASAGAEEVNRLLAWLNRIDNVDWVPVALELLRQYSEKPAVLGHMLEKLERLSASLFIRRCYVNERIEKYARVLNALDGSEDLERAFELSSAEKAETMEALDSDLYLETKTRLYVLLRLDSALSGGGATYDYKIVSVEHVLPQSPGKDSEWVKDFDEAARAKWTHRIANLLLLTRRKNSQARNWDFQKKKEKYFTGKGGVTPFALTTQVVSEPAWTEAVLETRQTKLLQVLTETWALH